MTSMPGDDKNSEGQNSRNTSDEEIVYRYRTGDINALTQIVDRYMTPVYNYLFRLTGNKDDAEDAVSETFYKMWKSIHQYRAPRPFRSWLFGIAHNTAVDMLRKKKVVPISYFDNEDGENIITDTLADDELLSDEVMNQKIDAIILEKAFAMLPPLYREVVVFRFMECLSFEEIGTVVGVPVSTVRGRYSRSRVLLRKILEKLYTDSV